MSFNVNDPGTQEVWDDPPPWFVYFLQRLDEAAKLDRFMAAELDDAIEKISPYGTTERPNYGDQCELTFSHTQYFCGNPRCRKS